MMVASTSCTYGLRLAGILLGSLVAACGASSSGEDAATVLDQTTPDTAEVVDALDVPPDAPADLATDASPQAPMACAAAACGSWLEACEQAAACKPFLDCATSCPTSSCVIECGAGVEPSRLQVVLCAAVEGCLTIPVSKCGNGYCDATESPKSCPGDCPTAPCGGRYQEACGPGAYCSHLTGLCVDCQFNNDCAPWQECVAGACVTAGAPHCGNAKCESGEDVAGCPVDCGGVDPVACAKDGCVDAYGACEATAACATLLGCLAECHGALDCYGKCAIQYGVQGLQTFLPWVTCARGLGCL